MNTSLTQFCKQYNLPKTTVYRDCQRLQLSTVQGLDEGAIATLKAEYGLSENTVETSIEAISPIVETGNHRLTRVDPELPAAYDLGKLRDVEEIHYDDPLVIAHTYLQHGAAVKQALQLDIKRQSQRIQVSKQAVRKIDELNSELTLEMKLYQMESRINAAQQNELSDRIAEGTKKLDFLGKEQDSE